MPRLTIHATFVLIVVGLLLSCAPPAIHENPRENGQEVVPPDPMPPGQGLHWRWKLVTLTADYSNSAVLVDPEEVVIDVETESLRRGARDRVLWVFDGLEATDAAVIRATEKENCTDIARLGPNYRVPLHSNAVASRGANQPGCWGYEVVVFDAACGDPDDPGCRRAHADPRVRIKSGVAD